METQLRSRLLDAEADFLTVKDSSSLDAFSRKWSVLCDDFERAMGDGVVDESLQHLAHCIFSRVAILAESFVQLEKVSDSSGLMDEVEELLSQLSLEDTHPAPKRALSTSPRPAPPRPSPPIRRRTASSRFTPNPSSSLQQIPAAYDWLVCNFHNPYPSALQKRTLAAQSGISVRALEEWFRSVRNYIGWVSICKEYFMGYRGLAVEAARRLFTLNRVSELPLNVATAFYAARSRLVSLYPASKCETDSDDEDVLRTPSSSGSSRSNSFSFASSDSSPPLRPNRPPSLVSAFSDSEDDNISPESPIEKGRSLQRNLNPSQKLQASDDLKGLLPITTSTGPDLLLITPHPPRMPPTPLAPTNAPLQGQPYVSRKRARSDADTYPPPKRLAVRPQVVSAPVAEHPARPSQCASTTAYQGGGQANSDIEAPLPPCLDCDLPSDLTWLTNWGDDAPSFSAVVADAPSSATLIPLALPEVCDSSLQCPSEQNASSYLHDCSPLPSSTSLMQSTTSDLDISSTPSVIYDEGEVAAFFNVGTPQEQTICLDRLLAGFDCSAYGSTPLQTKPPVSQELMGNLRRFSLGSDCVDFSGGFDVSWAWEPPTTDNSTKDLLYPASASTFEALLRPEFLVTPEHFVPWLE